MCLTNAGNNTATYNTNKENDEQITAAQVIAGDVTAQESQLNEISELIATIKASVEGLAATVNKHEKAINALELYSRAN